MQSACAPARQKITAISEEVQSHFVAQAYRILHVTDSNTTCNPVCNKLENILGQCCGCWYSIHLLTAQAAVALRRVRPSASTTSCNDEPPELSIPPSHCGVYVFSCVCVRGGKEEIIEKLRFSFVDNVVMRNVSACLRTRATVTVTPQN